MPPKLPNSSQSLQCFLHWLAHFRQSCCRFFPLSLSLPSCLSFFSCLSLHPLCCIVLFISLSGPLFLSQRIYKTRLSSALSFLSVCTSIVRKKATTIFRTIHKQPSSGCYDTPQAIVIESHYSWDLTFNPSYVIGLLFAAQAGLTPQTDVLLAAMLLHCVPTPATSQR